MIFSSFTELFIRELWCKYKSIQIMEILCLTSWQLLMDYMVKKHFNVNKNCYHYPYILNIVKFTQK